MTGRLRIFALVVAAAMAISAVGATAASAVLFHSEIEGTLLRGEQSGVFTFDTTSTSVKCKKATYPKAKPKGSVAKPGLTPTAEPQAPSH